jgi:hypothetical protein
LKTPQKSTDNLSTCILGVSKNEDSSGAKPHFGYQNHTSYNLLLPVMNIDQFRDK